MLGWAAYRQSLAHRGAGKMGAHCQNQTPMALLRGKAISPLFPVAWATFGVVFIMKSRFLLAAFAASMAVSAAQAAVVDADGDGSYSFDEMQAAYAELSEDVFAQIDSDGNGTVSPDELAAAIEAGLIEG
jgi:hypothetical protein